MRIQHHPLLCRSLGSRRQVTSFHFGVAGQGEKIYLQGSLHADEIPGMLVLHHLKRHLCEAEAQGQLHGEIVLVPVANPIGLAQTLMNDALGRFELASGENFNRRYADLTDQVGDAVAGQLGPDAAANQQLIRATLRRIHASLQPVTELESLRHVLQGLALDADAVLDLHCDYEAIVHVYSETPYQAVLEPLTRYLGAQTVLLSQGSGGASFDEALSGIWWRLADRFPEVPIPLACLGTTIELRGEADVCHSLARQDAANLLAWLQHRGVLGSPAPALPPALCQPTPLAGSETVRAPACGALVFLRQPGNDITAGETVAEIIDPIEDTITPVRASISGRMYARENRRFATLGMDLCKIAGAVAFRSGYLLTA